MSETAEEQDLVPTIKRGFDSLSTTLSTRVQKYNKRRKKPEENAIRTEYASKDSGVYELGAGTYCGHGL